MTPEHPVVIVGGYDFEVIGGTLFWREGDKYYYLLPSENKATEAIDRAHWDQAKAIARGGADLGAQKGPSGPIDDAMKAVFVAGLIAAEGANFLAAAVAPIDLAVESFMVVDGVVVAGEGAAVAGAAEGAAVGAAVEGLAGAANELPARMARVVEAQFADSPTLAAPNSPEAFVVAADDIAGITNSVDLAQRLTLLDPAGKLREGPFVVMEFDTPEGLASPVLREAAGFNSGFKSGGLTTGGAREFVVPNLEKSQLSNLTIRTIGE